MIAAFRDVLRYPGKAVRLLIDIEHNRKFERWPGAYRGVFQSFAEAEASAPSRRIGFNHSELANIYEDRMDKVFPSDYPVLFWLSRAFLDSSSVFDFGGHVGIAFYAYRKYLEFPADLRWRVCDVADIAKAGQMLANTNGHSKLTFTTEFSDAHGFDILLAAGSLQFVEAPFSDKLRGLERRPRHILINKLPLHDGASFVTLQNTVHSFNPYKVENRRKFIDSVVSEGYELIDTWENADLSCRIPLHPEHSIKAYTGLYFRRRDG